MLSHIYRIVRDFQKNHHCQPNVLYLNRDHFHHLRHSFADPDDIDTMTQLLAMHIIISHDAVNPHLARIDKHWGHSDQLPDTLFRESTGGKQSFRNSGKGMQKTQRGFWAIKKRWHRLQRGHKPLTYESVLTTAKVCSSSSQLRRDKHCILILLNNLNRRLRESQALLKTKNLDACADQTQNGNDCCNSKEKKTILFCDICIRHVFIS